MMSAAASSVCAAAAAAGRRLDRQRLAVSVGYIATAGGIAACAWRGTPCTDMEMSSYGTTTQQQQQWGREEGTRLPSAYPYRGVEALRFSFDSTFLSDVLPNCECRSLAADTGTAAWIEQQLLFPRTALHSALVRVLEIFGVCQYDAQAILDSPSVHLLSAEQWQKLLSSGTLCQQQSVLDVGAGSGHITKMLTPIFGQHVYATEISSWLTWRLKRNGIQAVENKSAEPPSPAHLEAAGLPPRYGTVLALNILDRVSSSEKFLDALISLLHPGGRLIIALPLPYFAMPWEGNSEPRQAWAECHALPLEHCDEHHAGSNWEAAARAVGAALERAGLQVQRVVRAPYLCQGWRRGGEQEGLFILDDAVFVCYWPRSNDIKTPTTIDLQHERAA
jgi:SAM-dependent methyltransferase